MSENARARDIGPPHGSMAEEAAKLVDVAHLWLAGAAGAAGAAGDARDDGEVWAAATATPAGDSAHLPSECRGCPICRVKRVVAGVSPEVYEHLAVAVTSLGAALRALDADLRREKPR